MVVRKNITLALCSTPRASKTKHYLQKAIYALETLTEKEIRVL